MELRPQIKRDLSVITKFSLVLALLLLLVACQKEDQSDDSFSKEASPSYAGSVPDGATRRLGKGTLGVVAFSPDGQYVAQGGNVGLQLFDADSLEELWHLPVSSQVFSLEFSPDGKILAVGPANGALTLLETSSGAVMNALPANENEENGVISLAWTEKDGGTDEYLLASGFNDGNVLLTSIGFDPEIGSASTEITAYGTLDKHASGVSALAFSPNDRFLMTGMRNGLLNLWDAEDLVWVGQLQGHETGHGVQSLEWSPDGVQVISGSLDDNVIVWDVLTFSVLDILEGHGEDMLKVAYSPDGDSFFTVSKDGLLLTWDSSDLGTGQIINRLEKNVADVAWSADREKYITASEDGQLSLWEVGDEPENEPLKTVEGYTPDGRWVTSMAWSPNDEILAAVLGNDIILWDPETAERLKTLEGHETVVSSVAWSPEGDQLASADREGSIIIWDSESGEMLQSLIEHDNIVADLDWSADGKWLASAGTFDNTAAVWDIESGEVVNRLHGPGRGVWSVAWSPDGETLATGSTLGLVYLWDMTAPQTGEPIDTLGHHVNWVSDLDWSADGRKLASVAADNLVVVWDIESGGKITYPGHSAPVRGVAFSPDGNYVASVSVDGLVIIWDSRDNSESRSPTIILSGHNDGVDSVAWSKESGVLASGSDDGTIILWDPDLEDIDP